MEEKIFFLGRNVHDHISAARKNINSETPPFLERAVYYDNLSEESIDSLTKLAREESIRSLLTLNKEAYRLQELDNEKMLKNKHRMSFGLYFFNEKYSTKKKFEQR